MCRIFEKCPRRIRLRRSYSVDPQTVLHPIFRKRLSLFSTQAGVEFFAETLIDELLQLAVPLAALGEAACSETKAGKSEEQTGMNPAIRKTKRGQRRV